MTQQNLPPDPTSSQPSNVATGLSFRFHGNWCGPGWSAGNWQTSVIGGFPAIDKLDAACRLHDTRYAIAKTPLALDFADKELAKSAVNQGVKGLVTTVGMGVNRLLRRSDPDGVVVTRNFVAADPARQIYFPYFAELVRTPTGDYWRESLGPDTIVKKSSGLVYQFHNPDGQLTDEFPVNPSGQHLRYHTPVGWHPLNPEVLLKKFARDRQAELPIGNQHTIEDTGKMVGWRDVQYEHPEPIETYFDDTSSMPKDVPIRLLKPTNKIDVAPIVMGAIGTGLMAAAARMHGANPQPWRRQSNRIASRFASTAIQPRPPSGYNSLRRRAPRIDIEAGH
jgi:hypothetical protein